MKIKLFSCIALVSLVAVSLIGCSGGDSVKADESMDGAFKQAKVDGTANNPPPSKSSSKKAMAPASDANNTPQ
jgi:hypothetical protein